jgi:hypothetical protein
MSECCPLHQIKFPKVNQKHFEPDGGSGLCLQVCPCRGRVTLF